MCSRSPRALSSSRQCAWPPGASCYRARSMMLLVRRGRLAARLLRRPVRVVVTGQSRSDDKGRDREHDREQPKEGQRAAPPPAPLAHPDQKRHRRHKAERAEEQRAPGAGEEGGAGQGPQVMQDVWRQAKDCGHGARQPHSHAVEQWRPAPLRCGARSGTGGEWGHAPPDGRCTVDGGVIVTGLICGS